jgi:ATP-dependent exoDNAse (exonuclease V) beta subunit
MSESTEPAADFAARTAASEPSASILLEAPAGSGKTAVLTQRFLRLLCTVDDPGEILAITFTRKAAAEMRARVLRALRGEFAADDPEAATLAALSQAALARAASRGWRIDSEPQSLRIQTIDAFNYWLASQLPVASHAGGVLNVTETAGELYRRAARRTLLEAERDPVLAPDAQLLFERLDNHWMHLERLIAQMLHERGHWLRFVAGEDAVALCRRVNDSLASLTRARLEALCDLLPPSLRQRAQGFPGCSALGSAPADLAAWKHLAHLVLTKDDWRRQLSVHRLGDHFADRAACQRLRELIDELARIPGAREALLGLRRAPPAQLPADDAAAIQSLSRVLSRAAAELHAEFAASQRVDYTYVAGAARAALTEEGEPTDLALRTGLALKHILVDEFQDTSLAQYQLLEVLTAGWQSGDGRTLFVVGDPMQSIYRFRDAEVGLFLRARRSGIGNVRLQPLRLTRNFRASSELVTFANEVFARVFPTADDLGAGAVRYRPSVAARAPGAAPGGMPALALRLFPGRSLEAEAIAVHVAGLRQADPRGTVGVLVAAHAHAQPVIDALAARGQSALGVDLVPLRERMVVRDLVELTRALYDLADRAAWLAVLRAPWCGARLRSLTALSGLNDRQLVLEALSDADRLARCEPEDRPRLTRVREVLSAALAARGAGTVVDWLESTWLRLGASDAYPAEELADARAFFAALAERVAALEWRGPEDFDALLEHLYSAPPAGDNPVQVMTIHRAKGLEFDHVIVPALDRATRGAERRLLRWVDLASEGGESNLLIAPTPAVGPEEEGDLSRFLKELVRQRDMNERARLVYVAATRARRTLWLSASPPASEDGTVKPDRRSLMAILWPALAERFAAAEASTAADGTSVRRTALTRLVADWKPPVSPAAVPLTQLPAAYLATEPPEFSWVGETQRHIGTVVHAWLERFSRQSVLPAAHALGDVSADVRAQLARLGVPGREQERATGVILEALRRTLTDERGRWILAAGHRDAHSEWELSGVSAGRLRSVKIDRSFIDDRGTRWVIDFKTSPHEGGGLEEFLDQELERYRPQLEGYRGLAAAAGSEPVRAALYFPLLGAFRELT